MESSPIATSLEGPTGLNLPFDLSRGQPLIGLSAADGEVVGAMRVQQLLSLVPDPVAAEDAKRTETDPSLADYAELRKEVQRAVQGAKAKNVTKYANYIVEGLEEKRPLMLPPITLYHAKELETVNLGHGCVALLLPYGDFLIAIDGETQRIAWQRAALALREALGAVVKVVIHHGKSLQDARQGFYDLNTREVKPTASLAISMDTQDVATELARKIMATSDVLQGRVNLQRRQLRRSDPELLTISALRTGIVTTILGTPGLQVGSRPIGSLPDGTDRETLDAAVVDVWLALVRALESELQKERRPFSIVSASSVLAAIGVLAHHVVPSPPRKQDVPEWSIDAVLERLADVTWDRTAEGERRSAWDGIAGKFTQSGRFSIAGPKEVAHAIALALASRDSEAGQRIRGLTASTDSQPHSTESNPASSEEETTTPSHDLASELDAVLRAAGKPQRIKHLYNALSERGSPESAHLREADILLALRNRPEQFVRTAPGAFGLSEWGLESVRVVKKTRKVARSSRGQK